MNLSQLEVLVAVVDAGSLTEAAEVVGLTQSAVSYSLSKLEAELGVTLLKRTRKGVTLTFIGQEVLQHARLILAQAEIIRQKTAQERGLAVGKLRFGCVPHIPARLLTGIIGDFQHKYPDIEVVLFEGSARELMHWLENGIIDAGTVLIPNAYAAAVPLVQDEIMVLVSAEHPLAGRTTVRIDDLRDELMIGPKAEVTIFSEMLDITMPRLRYEVSARSTILTMVRENMGITIMPGFLIPPRSNDIVRLPLDPSLQMKVYLAANMESPVTTAFLANAHAWVKDHGFLPANA
jgi:DNA-binding transcriptional LysR family regulator